MDKDKLVGWTLMPEKLSPEMLKAAQVKSQIGCFVCAEWSGAYDCLDELYAVWRAVAARDAKALP